MGTTNRAEETKGQLSEKAVNFLNEDKRNIMKLIEATKNRPYKEETLEEFFINCKIEILPSVVAAYSLGLQQSQSEIDELTKVIDGYKSDSEELITTKELLLDLTISDKKVYDKQEQRIINLSEKLLISEKSEKFYKDRAKELSDILYLAESENAELTKEVERLRKDRELFEKRCVNLSKSTDEILEYLIPFVDNYLDDNDINRIIKWHNDNSNRH